jgi:hypothetical protein
MTTKVVCLIGSSRFKAKFHEVGERLEKSGVLALMMSFFQHADGRPVSDEEREVLRRVDRARVGLAHEVWVVNDTRLWCAHCKEWKDFAHWRFGDGMGCHVCPRTGCSAALGSLPYVGVDTLLEVGYAKGAGKPLRWLNPLKDCDLPFKWNDQGDPS